MELNMPSSTNKKLKELFANIDTIDEDSFLKDKEQYLEGINLMRSTALINLSDSYFRFLSSDYLIDIILIAFSDEYAKKKEKLVLDGLEVTLLNKYPEWDSKMDEDPCILTENFITSLMSIMNEKNIWKGNEFNFEALESTKTWRVFVQGLCKLQKVNLDQLSDDQYLAFLMNLYNLLFLHIFTLNKGYNLIEYDLKLISMKEYGYVVGEEIFTLHKIESLILREKKNMMLSFLKKKDINKRNIQRIPDILFSLIDLSSISPSLQAIHPNKLKETLSENAKAYLKYHVKIDNKNKKVLAPSIFLGHKTLFSIKGESYNQSVKKYIENYIDLPNYPLEIEMFNYDINAKVCLESKSIKNMEYVDEDTFKNTLQIYKNEILNLQNKVQDLTDLYNNATKRWEFKEKEYLEKIELLEKQLNKN